MLCYLKFTSCNIDDAALLNDNFISNKISLVRKLFFFSKNNKVLKTEIPLGQNGKKAGLLANTNKFEALKF